MLYGFNAFMAMIGLIFWSPFGFANCMIKLGFGILALANGAFFFMWLDKTYPALRVFMGL